MSENELRIGRELGSTCFFIYQFIRYNGNVTPLDIEIETGLSRDCVRKCLIKLRETKIVNYKLDNGHSRRFIYNQNPEMDTWKLQ